MKYWEIIANRLHAAGWSYGIAEHLTKRGLLFRVDAHRDGKRFIVRADDLLTAFLSLERDASALKAKRQISQAQCWHWTKVPYTAVGSAGKSTFDYVTRRLTRIFVLN